jgi:hypothetical protein
MSWKGDLSGNGKISLGKNGMESIKVDEDKSDVPAGWRVTVGGLYFKLAKA